MIGCISIPSFSQSPSLSNQKLSAQEELDAFYTVMAYAVTFEDWQPTFTSPRGANIGAVMVDEHNYPIALGLNTMSADLDLTKHAELGLIQQYFKKEERLETLQGKTLYTTLESCAMCAGTMTFMKMKRSVYGQTDLFYGKAFERLQFDSSREKNGYAPYPDKVIVSKSKDILTEQMDRIAKKYDWENGSLVAFLCSESVKNIYSQAKNIIKNYNPIYKENKMIIENAKTYFYLKILKK